MKNYMLIFALDYVDRYFLAWHKGSGDPIERALYTRRALGAGGILESVRAIQTSSVYSCAGGGT